jgi:hypothetical protein
MLKLGCGGGHMVATISALRGWSYCTGPPDDDATPTPPGMLKGWAARADGGMTLERRCALLKKPGGNTTGRAEALAALPPVET